MNYLDQIDAVRDVMSEPEGAEVQLERKVDAIIRDLDEIVAMAANKETVDLVEGQRVAVGQIVMRAQLVAAFLMTRQPILTVVKNNG